MIANRAFQGAIPGLDSTNGSDPLVPYGPVLSGWQAIGAAEISLNLEYPLSAALPTVLQVTIPWNATGEVGILNEGWWGVRLASFHRFLKYTDIPPRWTSVPKRTMPHSIFSEVQKLTTEA